MHYCGCDIQIHSVIDVSDESDIPVISDEHATAWEGLYVPSVHTREDHNQAPTEIAPLLLVMPKKGRHRQYLTHHILNLIKETHLQKNQPLGQLLAL